MFTIPVTTLDALDSYIAQSEEPLVCRARFSDGKRMLAVVECSWNGSLHYAVLGLNPYGTAFHALEFSLQAAKAASAAQIRIVLPVSEFDRPAALIQRRGSIFLDGYAKTNTTVSVGVFSQTKIRVGRRFEGRKIVEVGVPYYRNGTSEKLQFVPVKLDDGTYSILNCGQGRIDGLRSGDNVEFNIVLQHSEIMPRMQGGVGSDVWHIRAQENGSPVLLKMYYNYKKHELGREDEVLRAGESSFSQGLATGRLIVVPLPPA